jgi:hypothetical protein
VRVHLIPLGRGRVDLYAEPPDGADDAPSAHDGRVRRWVHRARHQWGQLVDAARRGESTSAMGRWRDSIVCRLADSLDEQRTLWALRKVTSASLLHPSNMPASEAAAALRSHLQASQTHHGRWLAVDLLLFIASGVLFFVPGPNIVAYYLGFRTYGHLQSWRGARQGLGPVQWTLQPSDALAELSTLVSVPHERRALRVEAIASALGLEHLPAFFERAAA